MPHWDQMLKWTFRVKNEKPQSIEVQFESTNSHIKFNIKYRNIKMLNCVLLSPYSLAVRFFFLDFCIEKWRKEEVLGKFLIFSLFLGKRLVWLFQHLSFISPSDMQDELRSRSKVVPCSRTFLHLEAFSTLQVCLNIIFFCWKPGKCSFTRVFSSVSPNASSKIHINEFWRKKKRKINSLHSKWFIKATM